MIQEYLKNKAALLAPDLIWTVDYYTEPVDTGVVYYEGGSPSGVNNETNVRYPQYMFFLRCKDWSRAEVVAHKLYKLFHKTNVEELIYVPELETNYRVYFIEAMSEPIRLGVNEDVMEYSLNLLITLREEN